VHCVVNYADTPNKFDINLTVYRVSSPSTKILLMPFLELRGVSVVCFFSVHIVTMVKQSELQSNDCRFESWTKKVSG